MNLEKLGVTKEEIEQSNNIKETFKFDELNYGDIVEFEFVDDELLEIEQIAKNVNKDKGIKLGDKIKVPAIKVYVLRIIPKDKEKEIIEYEKTEDNIYTLWLSSKTLAMGIGKISVDNNEIVKGISFKVEKSKAVFKTGENTCYRVRQILEETKVEETKVEETKKE